MIDFELRGGNYHLYLNGMGLFNIYAKYGQDKNILDILKPNTKESFEATIWVLCELSVQGELYRRVMGYEAEKPLEYIRTIAQVQPHELPAIKKAVTEAILEGFIRDHPDTEGYDPWLAEIEEANGVKKKSQRPSIFGRLRKVFIYLFKKA